MYMYKKRNNFSFVTKSRILDLIWT